MSWFICTSEKPPTICHPLTSLLNPSYAWIMASLHSYLWLYLSSRSMLILKLLKITKYVIHASR